jgi:hypothetical protein
MSKYIIELDDRIKIVTSVGVTENGVVYTTSDYVNNLEELNSDYINEHFGKLQDEAYQAGMDKAWEIARRIRLNYEDGGIDGDGLRKIFGTANTYTIIKDNTASEAVAKIKAYDNATHYDHIEVGDEVIDNDGDATIVTNIHNSLFDGLCGDGSTMSDLFLEDVRKTGRHYDHIGKLLEAIRA